MNRFCDLFCNSFCVFYDLFCDFLFCLGRLFPADYDDEYNLDDKSTWELTKRALGFKCRALKCTLLIIFELFLLACTIGLLVPFILYLHEEASTSIPLIVMFAVCSCSCVCYNCIMCIYTGCFYVSMFFYICDESE